MRTRMALFAALLLGGCTDNAAITKLADKACACADTACATQAANETADWLLSHQDARGDEEKARADFARLGKCLQDKQADLTKFMEAVKKVTADDTK